MEARFITDISKLVSEEQQQVLQRLLFVDDRIAMQAEGLGDVIGRVLPLLQEVNLSDKARSSEINNILATAQQDLEIIYADMALLAQTLERLSVLSDATVGAVNHEITRLNATLQQYRARLFSANPNQDDFRYVNPLELEDNQAQRDVELLVEKEDIPLKLVLEDYTPASFDAYLQGYTLKTSPLLVSPSDIKVKILRQHEAALNNEEDLQNLRLVTDPDPDSAWKGTLMVDAPLADGAQCELEIELSSTKHLNRFLLSPYNRSVIRSIKLYVVVNDGSDIEVKEGQEYFCGYLLAKDEEGKHYVQPPELQNLGEETGLVLLDRAVPVSRIRLNLIQIRHVLRKVEININGLKPILQELDQERVLTDPLWERMVAEDQGQEPISGKYEYLYGLKDLKLFEARHNSKARYISKQITVDLPVTNLSLSVVDRPVWSHQGFDPMAIYDDVQKSFLPKLPLQAAVDYRIRLLKEDMLDNDGEYARGLNSKTSGWAPLQILSQEWDEQFAGWLYDRLSFEKVAASGMDRPAGWYAPLAVRPLYWANDPFATQSPDSVTTAAVYLNGNLISRGPEGRVTYYQFRTTGDYGLHLYIPFEILPESTDFANLQFVAVYEPDPDYIGQSVSLMTPSRKDGSDVFATSPAAALADADNSAVGASAAKMVPQGTSEILLSHPIAPGFQPIVSKRKADGSYVPLFQQWDPQNPYIYRTAKADIHLSTVRFNGRPLEEVFGNAGELTPDGHLLVDLKAFPQGGVLTYLHGPSGNMPRSATEIASVRQDFTVDGNRLILSRPLEADEVLKVGYTYYRYSIVLDARLQRFTLDDSVTPTLTAFSLGGSVN